MHIDPKAPVPARLQALVNKFYNGLVDAYVGQCKMPLPKAHHLAGEKLLEMQEEARKEAIDAVGKMNAYNAQCAVDCFNSFSHCILNQGKA